MSVNLLHHWRCKTYLLFEDNMQNSLLARRLNVALIALIVINVIAVIMESEQELQRQYASVFYWIDAVSVMIFSLEYLLRLWVCVEKKPHYGSNFKARVRYFFSPMALVDLLVIIPFYISLFVSVDLRYLRLLRVMRILKLTHYFKGFNIFVTVLKKELRSISAAIVVMIFLVIIAASVMYTLENSVQPKAFGSIPQAMWWSVVTMTTVGYGDVTPVTNAGKVVAMIVMLLGIGFVALPAGMLAGRFSDELKLRRRNLDAHIREALRDGTVDNKEHAALLKLAEKLELRPEDLHQGINFHKYGSKVTHCPHCKKSLMTPGIQDPEDSHN